MKVIGIGLPKTGTTSLKQAFISLGLKFGGIHTLFDKSYEAHCGDSFCLPKDKYKTMDLDFPGAKFILTLRKDVDTWYDSICRWSVRFKGDQGLLAQRKRMYGSEMPDTSFKGQYMDHWYEVVEYFQNVYGLEAKDKLLVVSFDGGDGWKEICEFLDIPVPTVRFPHKNRNKK